MVNRGKQFEEVIRKAMESVDEISVDRIHDQTTGFKGSQNICDFIVYRYPYQYYFECKSVHGNTLSFNKITETQWKGLLEKSKIPGVFAGIICWWIDKDTTAFLPIEMLQYLKNRGYKSVAYYANWVELDVDAPDWNWCWIKGKKKRVFFDYDMRGFFNALRQSKN